MSGLVSSARVRSLQAHAAAVAERPVSWGADGCTRWAADWVETIKGIDLKLPTYRGEEQARALIARAGIFETLHPAYGDVVLVATRLGLLATFPNLWSAARRVRGIAQGLLRYVSPGMSGIDGDKFLQLYQSGPPEYDRIQRGELIYDPRSGGTVWSDNSVLAMLHALLGFPEFSLADFDTAFIAGEGNRADVLVATRTGSERRSRAWGRWDDANTNRSDLLLSTGTELIARPATCSASA